MARRTISKPKLKHSLNVEEIEEEPDKGDAEVRGVFTLTEVAVNGRNLQTVPPETETGKVNPKREKDQPDEESTFWKLSPRYIIEKVNDAIKNGTRVHFKGVGLESTSYYKKYMTNQEAEERHERNKQEAERYFRATRIQKRANEHMLSFNRIKDQLRKTTDKKSNSFAVVLESNLENAYGTLQRNVNRANAYQKYSYDIP